MLKTIDFKKIWLKICFGVLYLMILGVVGRIVRTILSVVTGGMLSVMTGGVLSSIYLSTGINIPGIIGDIVGFAAVSVFAYNVRLKRKDLREDYVSRIGRTDDGTPELFIVIPWGEFMFELAGAFVMSFITQFLISGRDTIAFVIFAAYMIVFAIADAYVWIRVHRKWEDESNGEG